MDLYNYIQMLSVTYILEKKQYYYVNIYNKYLLPAPAVESRLSQTRGYKVTIKILSDHRTNDQRGIISYKLTYFVKEIIRIDKRR